MGPTHVLFIGGRSGVGKSSVAAEASLQFAAFDVRHAVIEGDNLDQAYPEPWRAGVDLAERNLAATWSNYRAVGYARLIFTNTVSVLHVPTLSAALGGEVRALSFLLTATDETAASRLAGREIGSGRDAHIRRSADAARRLDHAADGSVSRIATDGRTVSDIAADIVAASGWADAR
ncbi:adenylyl-sulfate kinase [uncultured Microbacterium sp.]|uniref:adenylyl-sulfate kinase n=1 Tax=uncultured Microbacterium sp. TaxID=191216 RepID=UPI0028DBA31E|nr:adenylyl-sulfate kinase [uncultured Microbacterium sp.]